MTTEITTTNKYFVHILNPTDNIKDFIFVGFDNIDSIKEDSAQAIYVYDLFDYISENSINKTIRHLRSKLLVGGKLYIQGTDIQSAAVSLVYGQIDINMFKNIIYGMGKKSTYDISYIRNIITNINGIKIISIMYVNASQYYIECVRDE